MPPGGVAPIIIKPEEVRVHLFTLFSILFSLFSILFSPFFFFFFLSGKLTCDIIGIPCQLLKISGNLDVTLSSGSVTAVFFFLLLLNMDRVVRESGEEIIFSTWSLIGFFFFSFALSHPRLMRPFSTSLRSTTRPRMVSSPGRSSSL